MKFDCAFTDPASLRFKRAARLFVPDWDELAELVVFVESIGGAKHAKYIFGWGHAQVRAYHVIRKHGLDHVQAEISANRASFGLDDGLAVLSAMQAGGFKGGQLPKVVRDALREAHVHMTYEEIAKATGLKYDQVVYACGHAWEAKKRQIAAASAMLA